MSQEILEMVWAAEEGLTLAETHSFHNYLIGALAASGIHPEIWRQAISSVTRKASSAEPSPSSSGGAISSPSAAPPDPQ